MKRLAVGLVAIAVVAFAFTAPVQAQRHGGGGGGWHGGGWSGGYGGWHGGYGGWYGGYPRYGYGGWYGGSPYYGYSGWYGSPYYSGYSYSPYYYGSAYTYSPMMTVPYDASAGTYAAAPQTQTYQSFYNAPASDRVSLRIKVPDPNARVWVDDRLTDRQGRDRQFVSPSLQPGQDYHYTVRSSWMDNGREVTRQKVLTFKPGEQLTVNFADPRDTAITDVTPTDGTRPAAQTITPADRNTPPPPPRPSGTPNSPDVRPDRSTSGTPTTPPPPNPGAPKGSEKP